MQHLPVQFSIRYGPQWRYLVLRWSDISIYVSRHFRLKLNSKHFITHNEPYVSFRVLQFVFKGDEVHFANDPMGPGGPTLDQFLRFWRKCFKRLQELTPNIRKKSIKKNPEVISVRNEKTTKRTEELVDFIEFSLAPSSFVFK